MSLGSRGHDLNMRVQQLEDELPAIEKALLSEPNQLRFAYTNGELCFSHEAIRLFGYDVLDHIHWLQALIGMQAYGAIRTTVPRVIYHGSSATIMKNAEGLLSFSFLTSKSRFGLGIFVILVKQLPVIGFLLLMVWLQV